MGHHITAIIIADPFDAEAARRFDLAAVALIAPLTLFHVDHYYSAYWQAVRKSAGLLDVPEDHPSVFPRERVLLEIVADFTGRPTPTFALIQTDYFGGVGEQWACVFKGEERLTSSNASINAALRMLGVFATSRLDEFDTVGLSAHRYEPEYLERYRALCDELGV